ncbi:MAG: 16S rRNA (guanine(966)-N(2))-methyltransferase RsmD [Streptosporangiales bacterium]|nr:16S rRNA (guanine(966)-N(2))-methyltransferase RsmD [Streptosporangiales bacterium]
MTRIVAGTAGGRRIAVPRTFAGRPTSERAREALFASLTSRLGSWEGRRFADLYAGTGAVGLEALSRGASHGLLVESDRSAARAIAANARDIGLDDAVVVSRPVEQVTAAPPAGGPYDVLFLDPPYPLPAADVRDVVAALLRNGWCATGGVVVVERASRDAPFPWPDDVDPGTSRRYGDATFWYGHAHSAGERRET